MPQWFCWYSRSGSAGCTIMQCGSWPNSGYLSGRKSARTPLLSGCQLAPRSRLSKVPPLDIDTNRCSGSRGSSWIECRSAPSGEPGLPPLVQSHHEGRSLKPATPCHETPPSCERKRPEGLVPQYHVPCSRACPGARKKSILTAKPREPVARFDFAPFGSVPKRGGRAASFQVLPRLVER